jgi:hypothetical protein
MRSKYRQTDIQFEFEGYNYSVDVDGMTESYEGELDLVVIGFDALIDINGRWLPVEGTTAFLNDAVRNALEKTREFSVVRV